MNYKEETIQVDQDSRVSKLRHRIDVIRYDLKTMKVDVEFDRDRPWIWYREYWGLEAAYLPSALNKLKSKFHRVYNLNGTDETITTNLETMIEDLKKG